MTVCVQLQLIIGLHNMCVSVVLIIKKQELNRLFLTSWGGKKHVS